jgi:hypothetical protein
LEDAYTTYEVPKVRKEEEDSEKRKYVGKTIYYDKNNSKESKNTKKKQVTKLLKLLSLIPTYISANVKDIFENYRINLKMEHGEREGVYWVQFLRKFLI